MASFGLDLLRHLALEGIGLCALASGVFKDMHLVKMNLLHKGQSRLKFLLRFTGKTNHNIRGDGRIIKGAAHPFYNLRVLGRGVFAAHTA
ncbi:hypothetical protein SDC9_189054 [bioreactor metagenome]|uniref:Uncharacterized protein n=1 Tax=bioreactor metagenome TaxID=1076179 RepID=A0A645HSP8_9ZZZZ